MNQMKAIRVEKITLNIGAGKDQNKLEKGIKLLKQLTGTAPVKTVTKKRIPAWGLRPGLPVGCKLTLRKQKAQELLLRLLRAKDNTLSLQQFDDQGSIAFGIPEYIDIPDAKYDPEIGVIGLEVCVTLERPGYRIKKRRVCTKKIPVRHQIRREDAVKFMQTTYKVEIEGESS